MKTIVLLTALALAACAHSPTPDPNAATCSDVCAHGAELSCVWATPTPLGKPCVEVCLNASRFVPWELECLSTSNSCSEASICGKR